MANGMPLGGLEGLPKSGAAAHQGINCPSLGLDLPPIGLDLPPLLAPKIGLPFNQRAMPPYQGMGAQQPMPWQEQTAQPHMPWHGQAPNAQMPNMGFPSSYCTGQQQPLMAHG